MRYRKNIDRKGAFTLIAVLLTCAILGGASGLCAGSAGNAEPYADLLEKHRQGDSILRVRADTVRGRLWVLTVADVRVYDTTKRTLIRRIGLPNWSVAGRGFACPPDIVLDRGGGAFVSSNVEPRLLQIGPGNFRRREHQLALVSSRKWDVGFGGLAFDANGTLLALSAVGGSLFAIDLRNRIATEIAATPLLAEACPLALDSRLARE